MPETRRMLAYWSQSVSSPDDLPEETPPSVVYLSRTAGDEADLRGRLTPGDTDVLTTALDSLMTEDLHSEPATERGSRTTAQRRADALMEMARRFLQSGEGAERHGWRPHLSVIVDHETLDCVTWVGPVRPMRAGSCPATARRLGCDAEVSRIVLGPDSEILDVGRSRRTVTAAQWKALVVRDRHCSHPGCARPPDWCDAHHLRHWVDLGETDLDNLVLLCRRHHVAMHEGGFSMAREGDELVFRRPDRTVLARRAPP